MDQVPFDKTNADLPKYRGTFYSDELETAYKIELVNGRLVPSVAFYQPFSSVLKIGMYL